MCLQCYCPPPWKQTAYNASYCLFFILFLSSVFVFLFFASPTAFGLLTTKVLRSASFLIKFKHVLKCSLISSIKQDYKLPMIFCSANFIKRNILQLLLVCIPQVISSLFRNTNLLLLIKLAFSCKWKYFILLSFVSIRKHFWNILFQLLS